MFTYNPTQVNVVFTFNLTQVKNFLEIFFVFEHTNAKEKNPNFILVILLFYYITYSQLLYKCTNKTNPIVLSNKKISLKHYHSLFYTKCIYRLFVSLVVRKKYLKLIKKIKRNFNVKC